MLGGSGGRREKIKAGKRKLMRRHGSKVAESLFSLYAVYFACGLAHMTWQGHTSHHGQLSREP